MLRCCRFLIPALAVCLLAGPVGAEQVRLNLSMDRGILHANKKQTAVIKTGLTGFRIESKEERTPVNVSIILDKSGSMSGQKIARAKDAAIAAIGRLNKDDIVSVVAYDSTVKVIVPATKLSDKEMIIQRIRQIGADGSTALFAGVSKGADEIRKFYSKKLVNRVILLSDGLANVGPQSPGELAALGASLKKEGISVSTMGLGLDYNEDLMTKLAGKSGGNHVFIENAQDLVKIFNYEFNDVLSVVAQEVIVDMKVADNVRPVRVLNSDAEINGKQVIVNMSQLYSEQEKYVLLEVEVPAMKDGQSIEVATVNVSYANMQTETTDRLSSTVSVKFSKSEEVVARSYNPKVCTAICLQIANAQNELATRLRDEGQIEEAKRVLLGNSRYLEENADKFNSALLRTRGSDNRAQALNIDGKDWGKYRKIMRQQQYADSVQQSFEGSKR